MYKAKSGKDIVAGIDEYAEDLTVLPASVWDPAIRIEPPQRPIKVVSTAYTAPRSVPVKTLEKKMKHVEDVKNAEK